MTLYKYKFYSSILSVLVISYYEPTFNEKIFQENLFPFLGVKVLRCHECFLSAAILKEFDPLYFVSLLFWGLIVGLYQQPQFYQKNPPAMVFRYGLSLYTNGGGQITFIHVSIITRSPKCMPVTTYGALSIKSTKVDYLRYLIFSFLAILFPIHIIIIITQSTAYITEATKRSFEALQN